jgi:hypothetical protein
MYILDYWADDHGRGQIALKTIRLKSIQEAYPLSLEHNRPIGTVLITVNRSDHQSVHEKEIWRKEGYNV